MTTFLRLLADKDKQKDLAKAIRTGGNNVFEVHPSSFFQVPGAPFAYWVSDNVRSIFTAHQLFESNQRTVLGGLKTLSDDRFLRCWWEPSPSAGWVSIAKGGVFSPFYADLPLVVNWASEGLDISWYGYQRRPREGFGGSSRGVEAYFRPGITWGRRTQAFGPKLLPSQSIFSDKGPAAFVVDDSPDALLALCALVNSQSFRLLVSVQLARVELAQSFEVGLIQQTPVPDLTTGQRATLAALARRAWTLKRTLDTIEETSHAFVLPATLRARLNDFAPSAIEAELARIQSDIDDIAFDLYGFDEADRAAVQTNQGVINDGAGDAEGSVDYEVDAEDSAVPIDQTAGLLSWAVGVAFGRFDWHLATGERDMPPEPGPFDPLLAKSPGMLPDVAAPFHACAGVLVDDQGHPHDLARLIEEVLARVEVPVPEDVRRWLQRDFFAFHLLRYSKSRRKAPIYWPLATTSGSYTLWVYYPSLSSQTLYTVINDFVEPKLKQIGADVTVLRNKGPGRTRDDEKQFETLQAFELELMELRDILLKLAPTYNPNHDDGVQISATPLWSLFRHKPWQKVLKDTWTKLKAGDYDWSHLAMNYWPDRVHEKCRTDKSLAIAHGLENLYIQPEAATKKPRGGKKVGSDE
jgi:hypothetical protein